MNRFLPLLIAVSLSALSACATPECSAPEHNNLTMWYNAPAAIWQATLPLGNGRIGCMPDGGVSKEHILLNDITMWSGSVEDTANDESYDYLSQIRLLLQQGRNLDAQDVMYRHFVCRGPGSAGDAYGSSQLVGWLNVEHTLPADSVTDYQRGLQLDKAVAYTVFKSGDTAFKREYLASRSQDVIAIRYTASRRGGLSMTFSLDRPERATVAAEGDCLIMSGQLDSGNPQIEGVKYYTVLRAVAKGGSTTVTDSGVAVDRANEVIVYISTSTDYWGNDCRADAARLMNEAVSAGYDKVHDGHIAAHAELFDRVSLDMGEGSDLPTDQRLGNFQTDDDPAFAALYMQFGRYLLISSTREGSLPPNLQGMWTCDTVSPWRGDYHLNINVEMNHWIAEPGNLAELHRPLIEYTKRLVPSGEQTARSFYRSGGWCAHVLANAWNFTATSENPSWGATNTGGAWLAMHLWRHYLYNPDSDYLASVYPVLRGAARFFMDNLIEEPDHGWLVTAPTSSPENGFYPNGSNKIAYVCMGSTMDNQIVRELFDAVATSSDILDTDHPFADSLRQTALRLPPNRISENGYLMEWLEDYREMDIHHRHVSHLFGLYPGNEITRTKTPELIEAARVTLDRRGDGGTGWSRAWKINFWARIGDGNRSYKLLKSLLEPSFSMGYDYGRAGAGTYPNLFCAHPPFQIDGNFGGSAGVVEMLIQSHDGFVELLPALPDVWSKGSYRGLCAEGGFEVDCAWSECRVQSFTVRTKNGGKCRIKSPFEPDQTIEVDLSAGESRTFER